MARILIIDDDVPLCSRLKDELTRDGFEVSSASLGREGLQMATNHPPDLILLDVMLPDETGFQTCAKLRRHLQTRGVPIILMSNAGGMPSQQALGKLMGANDYVPKPLNIIELGDKVHGFLGTRPLPAAPIEQEWTPEPYVDAFLRQESPLSYKKLDLLPSSADLFDDPPEEK